MESLSKTSKLYAYYLIILPLVSIYRLPGASIALATVLTLIMALYAIVILIKRKVKVNMLILLPFVLYILYIMTKSTQQFTLLCVMVLIHILAICTGILNVRSFRNGIVHVSIIASVLVIAQQVVHIVSGGHIPLFIGSLLTDGMYEKYRLALITGMSNGMYRPSAFFLEPSHFTQYCMIGLGSSLFHKQNFRIPLLITLGILATTSGMGVVTVFFLWLWWGLNNKKTTMNGSFFLRVFAIFLSLIIGYFILDNISITHNAIARFTVDSNVADNAITGRLFWWDTYFGNASFSDYIEGYGLESLPDEKYFTGFMKQLYCYGIIGISLLFVFLIIIISISDKLGKGLSMLYTGLVFFSELTGYFWMIFFFGMFLSFYVLNLQKRQLQETSLRTDNFDANYLFKQRRKG